MSVHTVSRGDGSVAYETRWREGRRNRARRFDRKTDARTWDAEKRRGRQLGPLASATNRVTLADWITGRWGPEHAEGLEPSTRALYARLYAKHIEPTLGHLPLLEVSVEQLRRWTHDRLAAGASADQVIKARTVLSSVLRHAAESEAIPANPVKLVRPPAREHRDEVLPLTPAEVERIRAELDPRAAALVSVLAYAGLRPGELRALRWGDIRDRTLLVQRAARPDGTVKSTKTRRARTVRLLAPLVDDLDAWRLESAAAGPRAAVFPVAGAAPAWPASAWAHWRRSRWKPACVAAGMDPIPRPYDLRHSFASLLLAEGKTVHDVADQLGHGPELTLRVYGHVIEEYAGLRPDQRPDAEAEITRAREEHHRE